jgi:hypothetical protein
MSTTHLYGARVPLEQREFYVEDLTGHGGHTTLTYPFLPDSVWLEDIDEEQAITLLDFLRDAEVNEKFNSQDGETIITRIK